MCIILCQCQTVDVVFQMHTDDVFVLEGNPTDSNILLSAGHDGLIVIWDLISGKAIKSFTNEVMVHIESKIK